MQNVKKVSHMLDSNKLIALLLGVIVTMIGWYFPSLSSKVDENQQMERAKLEQIYEIKLNFNTLNSSVSGIEKEIVKIKKNNEYIIKNVNDRFDIQGRDIQMLCSQIKRYGESVNWTGHPECQSK